MSCKTHCCKRHGCKYGYDWDGNCPVFAGTEAQEYPCERCVNISEARVKIEQLYAEIAFVEELEKSGVDISYNKLD